jgi:hypothetical protein
MRIAKESGVKKTSFQELYPDYPIIPEKNRWYFWAANWIWLMTLAAVLPLLTLKLLSYTVPTPNQAGSGKLTQMTARHVAMQYSERGDNASAAASFQKYFALGGTDADMMAMYAFTLAELGRRDEAKTWSKKASVANPKSKAAQMVEKALSEK